MTFAFLGQNLYDKPWQENLTNVKIDDITHDLGGDKGMKQFNYPKRPQEGLSVLFFDRYAVFTIM
jgi:hypothetical protein